MKPFRECVSNRLGAILVVGALVLGGGYYYQVMQEHERAACQSRYNQAFSEQARIRNQFLLEADDARDHLLRGVGDLITAKPTTDPDVAAQRSATFRELFVEYAKKSAELELARENTPLPATPDCH